MIFTGLSNNWALLQRVNAIEKYLSENPIVPYAKSSVAGEGTDTFVFDKSQLSVANGAGLMVGDLIICPDVTLWQVISIADSGEVTARFLVNFKGEQGIQGQKGEQGVQGEKGEQGEQGISQLVYNLIYAVAGAPSTATTYDIDNVQFNRTPIVNDRFIMLYYDTDTKKTYICVSRVNSVSFSQSTINIIDLAEITGQKGDKGKDALVYNGRVGISYSPTVNTGVAVSLNFSDFNYNPVIGDIFIANLYTFATTPAENYIACLKVDGVQGTKVTGVVPTALTAISGVQAGKLYRHRIKINHSDEIVVEFDVYNRSATQFNYTTLKNYLNGKIYNAVGYTATPPDFGTAVKEVMSLSGTINVVNNNNGSVEIEEVNTTVTDTVEEI